MHVHISSLPVEKVWIDQGNATKAIKRRLGAKRALDYVIGEKLMMFAGAAKYDPAFAKELPKFSAAMWQMFNQYEIAGYIASRKAGRTKAAAGASLLALALHTRAEC